MPKANFEGIIIMNSVIFTLYLLKIKNPLPKSRGRKFRVTTSVCRPFTKPTSVSNNITRFCNGNTRLPLQIRFRATTPRCISRESGIALHRTATLLTYLIRYFFASMSLEVLYTLNFICQPLRPKASVPHFQA